MMQDGVAWILGSSDRAERTSVEELLNSFSSPEIVYGGYLWSDLDLDFCLPRFHQRLLLDFRAGWSAVGFTSRGDVHLGPWSAPTSARPHAAAPFGLYLLSADRLRRSVSAGDRSPAESAHARQSELGPVFCDPKLEVRIQGRRNFRYKPPSKGRQILSALSFLVGGSN